MNIETTQVTLRKMTAKKGYVFKQADGESVYGNMLYLSAADAPENYIEVPESEKEDIV